ncbi:MAG: bifunctional tRNA (5-methylaminomethyl-2-thiouridine)(34)-methyltransferase MnmD/FAD-dependent 5-carboxymethylaminomethyl-2-thiouridine(34) oxidoreductase MnmC [Tatlockia sp.]|nr:bifunctional tRNA (5-methylaminomethyl-2-thiouridine)(34)-methyltransferase MnmD/FAD-dependent 5-carboxymethylaminomethyl-2-thiouridine(34) oxidoreductase MnmC [Tatlockia sp.]
MSQIILPIELASLSWPGDLPFSQTFNESYLSVKQGLAAKEHVFINGNQLKDRWSCLTMENFVIAEIGFGLGLNFLLSLELWLKQAPKSAKLYYFSCEKLPLAKADLQRALALWPQLTNQAEILIENYPILTPGFHQLQFVDGRVNLILMLGEASTCFQQLLICGDLQFEQKFRKTFVDAWFLDGFSPQKNPALWSADLFNILALLSKKETSLATYSTESLVKNNLKAAGFLPKQLPGLGINPPMLVAKFKAPLSASRNLRSTAWHSNANSLNYKAKKIIVLGAGLAGCYTAHALAKRGWQVCLIDENSDVGQGASGNRQAVLYPKLSAFNSPVNCFMLNAYLFAIRHYRQILRSNDIGELSGVLQLAHNEKERLAQANLANWIKAYPEFAQLVNAEQASALVGIKLTQGGLFISSSGWINAQALCRYLIQSKNITYFANTKVNELVYKDSLWHVDTHSAEVLVLANGHQATQFYQSEGLPLTAIRGQISFIASNAQSQLLKMPLCGKGHVLPASGNAHALGATYELNNIDLSSNPGEDQKNLMRLDELPTELEWSSDLLANWVGIRATTTDYLPLVGPIPDLIEFNHRFVSLANDAKRWLPYQGAYLPGLFLCAGFGSRGLTTIPLAAEYLASTINQEPLQITQAMVRSLSPARFLIKKLIKLGSSPD